MRRSVVSGKVQPNLRTLLCHWTFLQDLVLSLKLAAHRYDMPSHMSFYPCLDLGEPLGPLPNEVFWIIFITWIWGLVLSSPQSFTISTSPMVKFPIIMVYWSWEFSYACHLLAWIHRSIVCHLINLDPSPSGPTWELHPLDKGGALLQIRLQTLLLLQVIFTIPRLIHQPSEHPILFLFLYLCEGSGIADNCNSLLWGGADKLLVVP